MSKEKTRYVCQECGASYSKWAGKCEACGAWNSILSEAIPPSPFIRNPIASTSNMKLHHLDSETAAIVRRSTGIAELDRALGGGMVNGSATLIGGEPGIGKSTLLLQVAANMSKDNQRCLYLSGEESAEQIKLRAQRLGVQHSGVEIGCGILLKDMLALIYIPIPPQLVIIDSIQTIFHNEISASPGTVSQVRACAFELIRAAKQCGSCLVLVGHVTKDGQIAGPKVLEHMVDTVLYFEGEQGNSFRLVRAVKNRFGAANEIGVFEMQDNGLSAVDNPSALFLSHRTKEVTGVSVFAAVEGTRTILVEVQALIVPTFMASPRRSTLGWDSNRLATLIAVLNIRYGINLLDKEVYLNFAGGIRIEEPAADLAVIAALISAATNISLPQDTVFFGEVGLSGEVRQVSHQQLRLNEANKLGFKRVVCPSSKKSSNQIAQINVSEISDLKKIIAGRK